MEYNHQLEIDGLPDDPFFLNWPLLRGSDMVVARKIFGVFDDSKWHPKPLYSLLFKKPMKSMVLNMGEIFTGNYSLYIIIYWICMFMSREREIEISITRS